MGPGKQASARVEDSVERDSTGATFTPAASRTGGIDAALLFVTGFAMATAGLLLAAAPGLSWQLTKVLVKLDSLGLSTGTLFMGGMALVGLGMVSRSIANLPSPGEDEPESALLLEQLATDLAQTRASLSRLDRRVAGLTKAVREERREVQQPQGPASTDPTESTDALWRLAASLDQLGARLERGLDEQVQGLAMRLDELSEVMDRLASAPAPEVHVEEAAVGDVEAEPRAALEAVATPPAVAEESSPDLLRELNGIDFLSDPGSEVEEFGAVPEPAGPALDLDTIDLDALEEEAGPRSALPGGPAAHGAPQAETPGLDLDRLLPDDRIEDSLDRARGDSNWPAD